MSASVMQVLGCSLPSLAVCHKADRPPRLEFFSDSCSCRQEENHSCSAQSEHGAPCLEEDCTDVHLKSHVLLTAAAYWQRASVKGQRRTRASERLLPGADFLSLRPVPDDCVLPQAESPPPLSPAFINSRLRC